MPIARHLKQPTRRFLGAGQAPAARTRHPSARPCSGWGLPGQPSHLGCRCALTAPFHPYLIPPDQGQTSHRRYLFCGTFPDLTTGRRYRPPCPAEPGLSSLSSRPKIRRSPRTQNSDHSAHSTETEVSRFRVVRGSVSTANVRVHCPDDCDSRNNQPQNFSPWKLHGAWVSILMSPSTLHWQASRISSSWPT
jgi:hypothetical protein